MMRRTCFLLVPTLLTAVACGERPAATTDSLGDSATVMLPPGEHRLAVADGSIWYKVTGETATGAPVILLHGGPGYSSFYLKPLAALSDERPVVRYDQLGAGKSDRMSDTSKFNIAHFVAELDSLRSHLGYGQVHLVGHSWGTILAVEYYHVHPDRVISLTLGSGALDVPAWDRNLRRLVMTLSDSAQRAIRVAEAQGTFAAPDYQAALAEYYGLYMWRRPVQADLDSTMSTANQDITTDMAGPSDFSTTGTLQRYNATPYLKDIKVPTLFTVGEFEEGHVPTIRRHAAMVPGARSR